MNRKAYIFSSVSALLLVGVTPTMAIVVFELGNTPQAGDENILLNSGLSGSTISGFGNNTGFQVDFSSTQETLTAPASGQARVEATSGLLNEVTIQVPDGSYETLIFNAFNGSGVLNIEAVANEPGGGTQTFNFSYDLSNGQNFSTYTTIDGETIDSVTLTSAGGFADLRQVRLGGISSSNVPDGGATAALLGLGIIGLAGFRRRINEV
jgi:hypothetical protein